MLILCNGQVLANHNPGGTRHLPDDVVATRDYLRGATNQTHGVYISKAFKAITDGKYKIGVSTAIRGPDGKPVAVVAAMIGTASTYEPT